MLAGDLIYLTFTSSPVESGYTFLHFFSPPPLLFRFSFSVELTSPIYLSDCVSRIKFNGASRGLARKEKVETKRRFSRERKKEEGEKKQNKNFDKKK